MRLASLLCNALVFGLLSSEVSAADVAVRSGSLRLTTQTQSLMEIRNQQIVRQQWDYSCGSAALSTVLTHHLNAPTPESAVIVSILRRVDPVRVRSRGGFSLLNLKHYLKRRGFDGEGYAELELHDLEAFDVPPIIPISLKGYDHFVVFRGRFGDRVVLADPAFGNLSMTLSRFQEIWKGGIGFVVSDVERRGDAIGLDVAALPFTNSSSVQRLVSRGRFARHGNF